jgi:small-conductance mechanosensitive channel
MAQQLHAPEGPFILTELARKRLDRRVAEAGNNIDAVENEIREELAELDSMTMPEEGPERVRMQAERAHLQGQRNYLNKVRGAQAT